MELFSDTKDFFENSFLDNNKGSSSKPYLRSFTKIINLILTVKPSITQKKIDSEKKYTNMKE